MKKLAIDNYPYYNWEKGGYGDMDNSNSLGKELMEKTKISDQVVCRLCGKGVWVPSNPAAEYNSWFTCSHCGARRHIERNVTVE